MTLYIDYASPSTQFSADMSKSPLFRKDSQNYINVLGIKQLNTLDNTSLLDIYLSKENVVEPHYHQNAAELVYCISGAAVVSLLNPFTNELRHFPIIPGQVANVPQAWWHYEIATVDHTHLLAIFNAPTPEVVLGSDILKITPAEILAHTYCLDEAKVKDTLAPIEKRTFIGPPKDCEQGQVHGSMMNQGNMMNQGSMMNQGNMMNQGSMMNQRTMTNMEYPNQTYPAETYPAQTYPNQTYMGRKHVPQGYPSQAYHNQMPAQQNLQQQASAGYRYPYHL